VREGDHYIINGQKIWTSRAPSIPTCCCCSPAPPRASRAKKRTEGLSVFLVDMRLAPGHRHQHQSDPPP